MNLVTYYQQKSSSFPTTAACPQVRPRGATAGATQGGPASCAPAVAAGLMLAVLAFALSGCAKPRLYPVCFYQAAPPLQQVKEVYAPQLSRLFLAAVSNPDGPQPTMSPDGRWLVARVTKSQNAKIAQVWPRIGCLGTALDSASTKLEADCVSYVQTFVSGGHYFLFGNAKDAGGFDIWNESPVAGTMVHCHQIKEAENQ